MELSEFRKKVSKAEEKKHHFKVNRSYGTKSAWRWIKKNKWLNLGQPITEREFGIIVKTINNTLQDHLLDGKDVLLPKRMGKLEIRKVEQKKEIRDNKLVVHTPIDWKKTIELWWEDEECHKNKTLVRFDVDESFRVFYDRDFAFYINKEFYKFTPTRDVKIKLKQRVSSGRYDALLMKKKHELY